MWDNVQVAGNAEADSLWSREVGEALSKRQSPFEIHDLKIRKTQEALEAQSQLTLAEVFWVHFLSWILNSDQASPVKSGKVMGRGRGICRAWGSEGTGTSLAVGWAVIDQKALLTVLEKIFFLLEW